jgi:hypothetical protein
VEGSEVWLFCEVNSREPLVAVTWTKYGLPLVQDVPHIQFRRTQEGTVSIYLLAVDAFQTSDNGVYQCAAQSVTERKTGTDLTLTGSMKARVQYYLVAPYSTVITSRLPEIHGKLHQEGVYTGKRACN